MQAQAWGCVIGKDYPAPIVDHATKLKVLSAANFTESILHAAMPDVELMLSVLASSQTWSE